MDGMKEYEVRMRLTFNSTVIVDAVSKENALEKARTVAWKDDGMAGAELFDWEIVGKPE